MSHTGCSRRGWLALVLMLAGCGGGGATDGGASVPPPTSPAPVVAPGEWVVLGSSTAAGVGASPGQGWVALLAAEMATRQVSVHNLARSGALTYQALPTDTVPPPGRTAPDPAVGIDLALSQTPRLLLLAFPTNDAAAGYSADETLANLALLRQRAQAQGTAAMLLSTQPRDGLTPAQREALDETDRRGAALFGPCFVDLREALLGTEGKLQPAYAAGDGIHLNDAGHGALHAQVSAALASGRCVRLGAN
jgi:lysophospholipase L1-like esterase